MTRWIDVATLIKVKGTKGRFVARNAPGLLFIPKPKTPVAFVPPTLEGPRNAVVKTATFLEGNTFEIVFEALEDRETTERLLGCHFLVERSLVESEDIHEGALALIGFSLWESGELIGTVSEILDNPGQRLLAVDRMDGSGLLYVPYVDAIVKTINYENSEIIVDLPSGLLEL